MTLDAAIVAERLVRRFGDFTAVDGLSFHVRPGEVFGLLGGNGSGKTTAIRMLCGILPPTEGGARVAGVDVVRDPLSVRSRLGYVAQKVSLYPNLRVAENVEFFGGLYGLRRREIRARAKELGPRLGLTRADDDALVRDLPLGVRQRLAFLIALLHRPRVLLLDEPTASVDLLNRRELFLLMHDLAQEGFAILLTSHHLDEMERCSRLLFVDRGKLVAEGTNEELKESLAGGRRFALEVAPGEEPRVLAEQLALAGLRMERVTQGQVVHAIASTDGDVKRLHQAAAELGVMPRLSPPSLESVLLVEVRRRRRATNKIGRDGLDEDQKEDLA